MEASRLTARVSPCPSTQHVMGYLEMSAKLLPSEVATSVVTTIAGSENVAEASDK